MSFQDDLWADEQYVDLMAQCRDAWLAIDHRLFTQPGFDWTAELKEYDRLSGLREARYVAVRRAWEDKE